jgi:glycosyltransferase involved in cell wall biosynthesis
MRKVVSILHHPLPQIDRKLAEESGLGWHFRSARALAKYGNYGTIVVRPDEHFKYLFKLVDKILVVLTPSINISPSQSVWKWSHVSTALADFADKVVKQGYIPYVHEYRALNSELVIRRVIKFPMILQHHGSLPPNGLRLKDPLNFTKELSKFRRENYLRKVNGFFYVLNRYEKYYLENILNVSASVAVRTMAVDFNELKLLDTETKNSIRRNIGINEDTPILTTYVGVFGEEFSSMKGAQYLFKIWRELRSYFKDKIVMIVTGVGEPYLSFLRRVGILAYKFLPHHDYIKLVATSDVYFLPATSGYSYGGIGVAVMEALAMGIPVVSPTLRDFPEPEHIKDLGVATRYVDNENMLKEFINALIYVIENRESFKPWVIRDLSYKYYSWESFIRDFNNAVKKL